MMNVECSAESGSLMAGRREARGKKRATSVRCEPCPCLSRFSRPSRLSEASTSATHAFDDRGRDKRGEMTTMFKGVNHMLTLLMSRAGECKAASQPESQPGSHVTNQGGGYDAGSNEKAEHWSEVCRSCDRRGARCL